MEKLISQAEDQTFIYLGDGNGDYCPSMKLRKGEYCMPRKNFPLWHVISSNPKLISASIDEWTDGGDLECILLSLINSIKSSTIETNTNNANNTMNSPTKETDEMNINNNSNNKVVSVFSRIDCKPIHEPMPMGSKSHEALPPALSVPQ